MSEWTFVTKHAVALNLIAQNPRITALELGGAIGVTERAARKLIADLFTAGYISKTREGRRVKYGINHEQPLRHDIYREVAVSSLLEALGGQGTRKGKRHKKQAG